MSGAMPSDGRDEVFQQRIARIAAKNAPPSMDDDPLYEDKGVSPLPDWRENVRYPASLVGAALAGAAAVFAARFARFHLTGGSLAGTDPDITMMIDGGLAALVSFILFQMLRFEGAEYKAAQTAGIFGMVCIMHNFVHAAPGAFNLMFSPQWTEEVTAMTEPKSILFRGISFVVFEDEDEKPKMPVVRRM